MTADVSGTHIVVQNILQMSWTIQISASVNIDEMILIDTC